MVKPRTDVGPAAAQPAAMCDQDRGAPWRYGANTPTPSSDAASRNRPSSVASGTP